jgi:hypothetical protein
MPGAADADVVVDDGAVGGAALLGAVAGLTAPDARSVVDGDASGFPVPPQDTNTTPKPAARVTRTTRLRARSTDMGGIKANGCTNPVPDH